MSEVTTEAAEYPKGGMSVEMKPVAGAQFDCYHEGVIYHRNPANHNICVDMDNPWGQYKFYYRTGGSGISIPALEQLIEDLKLTVDSFKVAGIK